MVAMRGSYYVGKSVWVAGHRGLAGSALVRRLAREDCRILTPARGELNLLDQAAVRTWMQLARPDIVFLAAGKVGGILANSRFPADFLYQNLMINANVIDAAHRVGIEKLVVMGSSCIYPRDAAQPIAESALLTGPLEQTNEAYAIAKIAGIKLAQAYARQHGDPFVSVMPTNLYGPNDNFDPDSSHVLAALVRRFASAKRDGSREVAVWGTGTPLREFLHADDLADACLLVAERCSGGDILNIGSGQEVSIRALAEIIAEIVGFDGRIVFDPSKPDGTPRKRLDLGKLESLGWSPKIPLRAGIAAFHQAWNDAENAHDRDAVAVG
jgi:GDP-L-fucose synthase